MPPSSPTNVPASGPSQSKADATNAPLLTTNNSYLLETAAFSPVNENGSFEFDRVIRAGEVLKRRRKTKTYRPIHLVLRPLSLSLYTDREHTKLRHSIPLSDITAVAPRRDSKRPDAPIFAVFTPARTFYFQVPTSNLAESWLTDLKSAARLDLDPLLPTDPDQPLDEGHTEPEDGVDAELAAAVASGRLAIGSSGEDEETATVTAGSAGGGPGRSRSISRSAAMAVPRRRQATATQQQQQQQQTQMSYGTSQGSFSSISSLGAANFPDSTLSLNLPAPISESPPTTGMEELDRKGKMEETVEETGSGATVTQSAGAGTGQGTRSLGVLGVWEERVMKSGWMYLLKRTGGVKKWKQVWVVLRVRGLALYKNEKEYSALLIVPTNAIINAVEVDSPSRNKKRQSCLQIITEERNYRFCALDEEGLAQWLGTLKSLISKRGREGTAAM